MLVYTELIFNLRIEHDSFGIQYDYFIYIIMYFILVKRTLVRLQYIFTYTELFAHYILTYIHTIYICVYNINYVKYY